MTNYSNVTGIGRVDYKKTNIPLSEYIGNARPGELVVDVANSVLYIGTSAVGTVVPVALQSQVNALSNVVTALAANVGGGSATPPVVVNDFMLNGSQLHMSIPFSTAPPSTAATTIAYFSYTCVGTNTSVLVDFNSDWFAQNGSAGNDYVTGHIVVAKGVNPPVTVATTTQRFGNAANTRGGSLTPIQGQFSGCNVGDMLTIMIDIDTSQTDDAYFFPNDSSKTWMRITEATTYVAPSFGGGISAM